MTLTAVLDTNVLNSGLLSSPTPPGRILERLGTGSFILVASRNVLDELHRVLARPYINARVPQDRLAWLLDEIERRGRIVPLTVPVAGIATHDHDDAILATALSGNAAFVVTGDKELLALGHYGGVGIVTPAVFLALLDAA